MRVGADVEAAIEVPKRLGGDHREWRSGRPSMTRRQENESASDQHRRQ